MGASLRASRACGPVALDGSSGRPAGRSPGRPALSSRRWCSPAQSFHVVPAAVHRAHRAEPVAGDSGDSGCRRRSVREGMANWERACYCSASTIAPSSAMLTPSVSAIWRTVSYAGLERPSSIRPSEPIDTPDLNASVSSVSPRSSRSRRRTAASTGLGAGARGTPAAPYHDGELRINKATRNTQTRRLSAPFSGNCRTWRS